MQSFTVVVSNSSDPVDPNDPSRGTKGNRTPIITSSPSFTADVDAVYQYQVVATDPDGDAFTLELAGDVPTGMQIDSSGLVTWTPTAADEGDYLLSILATDSSGASSTQGFLLNVTANNAPQILSDPVETATTGAIYRYSVTADDPDGDALSYRLDVGPADMSIEFRWTHFLGD